MSRHSSPLLGRVLATQGNPPSGARLLYPKADGWYDRDSAGIETRVDKSVVGATGGNANSKVFRHVLVHRHAATTTTGSLVISTPITFPGTTGYMTRIALTGYNYVTNLSDIDAAVTFYAYINATPSPAYANTSFRSDGNRSMTCRLARDASDRVVIILDNPEGSWGWTHLHIPFVQIGHALPPDSFATGWTAAVTTDLTPYTVMSTPVVRDSYTEITNLRARNILSGSGLTGGGNLTADRTLAADFGTGNTQVARGDHAHATPSNMVTTDTQQNISGTKIFEQNIRSYGNIFTSGTYSTISPTSSPQIALATRAVNVTPALAFGDQGLFIEQYVGQMYLDPATATNVVTRMAIHGNTGNVTFAENVEVLKALTADTVTPTQPMPQSKTHASPDTDTATTSLHHTIGTGANQAAAGNHGHTNYALSTHTHGSDTGWLDPFSDPAGAWVKHASEPLRIRKIDNRVTLVGIVQRGPTVTFLGNNTYERIHTLGATYQPVGRSIHGTLATQQSGVRMKFRLFRTGLANAGDLEIANDGNDLSTNGNVYFNITWLTD